jgi:hypothetical protein
MRWTGHNRERTPPSFGKTVRILSEYGAAISRLAFSYEAVASVREELVQEIALAIWQALAHFRALHEKVTGPLILLGFGF